MDNKQFRYIIFSEYFHNSQNFSASGTFNHFKVSKYDLGFKVRTMNDKTNNIFIFVKGREGRGAFYISNHEQNIELHSEIINDLLEDDGSKLNPTQSDFESIIKSLEYIGKNQGKNNIPERPAVFIYTSYESVYGGANPKKDTSLDLKEAREYQTKQRFERFSALRRELLKDNKIRKAVVYFVADEFKNEMDKVSALLGNKPKKKM